MSKEFDYNDTKIDKAYWTYFSNKAPLFVSEAMDVDIEEVRDWFFEVNELVKDEVLSVPGAINYILSEMNKALYERD